MPSPTTPLGDLPDSGIESALPALAGELLSTEPPGKPDTVQRMDVCTALFKSELPKPKVRWLIVDLCTRVSDKPFCGPCLMVVLP